METLDEWKEVKERGPLAREVSRWLENQIGLGSPRIRLVHDFLIAPEGSASTPR